MTSLGVHKAHCCILHLCKYGKGKKCPVLNGKVRQEFACERCYVMGIKTVEEVHKLHRIRNMTKALKTRAINAGLEKLLSEKNKNYYPANEKRMVEYQQMVEYLEWLKKENL